VKNGVLIERKSKSSKFLFVEERGEY